MNDATARPPEARTTPPRRFRRNALASLLIAAALLLLGYLLWKAVQVLLLFFAGILFSVLLNAFAQPLTRFTRMPHWAAITTALAVLLAALGGAIWIAAPSVAQQTMELTERLREIGPQLWTWVQQTALGKLLLNEGPELNESLDVQNLWKQVGGIFATTLGAITSILIIFFVGVFLAYDPRLYVSGFLRLIPLQKRARMSKVIRDLACTLRWWMVGQLISMVILFTTTWLMLALLGVPLAFILALLTGILTFVPYLGPIIALVPIVLVSLVEGPGLALTVFGLYMVIQNVEANVIMPLVYQETVHLPPALTIVAQILMGGILGMIGIIMATPLTAIALVIVQRLYVEDGLGDDLSEPVPEAEEAV